MVTEDCKKEAVAVSDTGYAEDYKAKHGRESQAIVFTADIPSDGYYKERLCRLEKENTDLRARCRELEKALTSEQMQREYLTDCTDHARVSREEELLRRINERDYRIQKLEKALVEASIR